MTAGYILIIFILIALNGFFVSVEFAAVASRRARVDLLVDANHRSGNLVRSWLDDQTARERLIAATQLGITMVSLALGAVGENAFNAWLGPIFARLSLPFWLSFLQFIIPLLPLLISITVVSSLHVILGEQVPKVAVLRAPESFAIASAPFMQIFGVIFKWFIALLDWATRQVLALFGLTSSGSHSSVYSIEEIRQMVSGPETQGIIEEPERKMLSAVIDFGELVVRQVSIPRTEISAVSADEPVNEALQLAVEKSLTKIPVYEGSLDQIIGIIHLRDMVIALQNGESNGLVARDLVRDALFVPETISVNHLLRQFRDRRMHIAIVLDEFGGTYGLVTLEDLLEEIIGEVHDPFETAPPEIQPMPDGSALIDGKTFLEDINNFFGLNLADPYYDTIAGYILSLLGYIPQVGVVVEDQENGIRLRVEQMERLRISQVLLRRL